MSKNVLPEDRQFEIAMHLHEEGMFGVHEDHSGYKTLEHQWGRHSVTFS